MYRTSLSWIYRRVTRAVALGALACPGAAFAQAADLEVPPGQAVLKLSGFENLDLADATGPGVGSGSESEIELSPQYRTPTGVTLAGRAVFNLQARSALGGSASAWALSAPELSVFAVGPFGRIELGDRAGFPQSLIGFTPSEIAFTAAEYGPDSGVRLDPNGGLPTAFLPAALGGRIDRLTYLGYAARFYDDRSPKLIYVSPRSRSGIYGAFSYTPRTAADGGGFALAGGARTPTGALARSLDPGAFRNVVQAAVVWNYRTAWLDLSTGVTASDATVASPSTRLQTAATARRSDSLSPGISATFVDTWTLGLSGTYDGLSQTRPAIAGKGPVKPYGVVASLNYVAGPWVVGGYYQHAVANTPPTIGLDEGALSANITPALHRDTVEVAEVGASYLLDKNHDLLGAGRYTDVKLFASAYLYRFRGGDASDLDPRAQGAVFISGIRFSFF
jgi:hypothetical protein